MSATIVCMRDVQYVIVGIDDTANFGDKVPIVIDETRRLNDADRQALAVRLQAPETIFINSVADADISIMHSQGEVDFAGVPALAAAWYLTKVHGKPIEKMRSRGGEIKVSHHKDIVWVQADLGIMPPWIITQASSPQEIESLTLEDTKNWQHTMLWAWIDEQKGFVRARTFAPDWNIPEAMANGSGSMLLAVVLGRQLMIVHGEGAVLFAKPISRESVAFGARAKLLMEQE
jgi:predicted PhzF superfamily epimerase YddE/YHI9